eukprot:scaffold27484_cov120-Isochrysis_galbana.AAC.7
MHIAVFDTLARCVGGLIFGCGEPCEALFKNIDAQRVERRHDDVDAQVELFVIDHVRVAEVPLHHDCDSVARQLVEPINQPNTATLRLRGRLENIYVALRVVALKVLPIAR